MLQTQPPPRDGEAPAESSGFYSAAYIFENRLGGREGRWRQSGGDDAITKAGNSWVATGRRQI